MADMRAKDRDDKLYKAEEDTLFPCRQFISVGDAQGYVSDVLASKWWKKRSGIVEVRLTYGAVKKWSQSWIRDGIGFVDITSGWLNEVWIVHEMGHLLAPKTGHGPEFFKAYMAMVRWKRGKHRYSALRKALEAEGVTW
jgi:putative metallohydrolase (TIGR04338 family)